LEDLRESDAVVEKLQKLVESLEQKLAAEKQEKEKVKAAAQIKPEEKKNGPVGQKETGKRIGGNWW
jgi:hypothetical protein